MAWNGSCLTALPIEKVVFVQFQSLPSFKFQVILSRLKLVCHLKLEGWDVL